MDVGTGMTILRKWSVQYSGNCVGQCTRQYSGQYSVYCSGQRNLFKPCIPVCVVDVVLWVYCV